MTVATRSKCYLVAEPSKIDVVTSADTPEVRQTIAVRNTSDRPIRIAGTCTNCSGMIPEQKLPMEFAARETRELEFRVPLHDYLYHEESLEMEATLYVEADCEPLLIPCTVRRDNSVPLPSPPPVTQTT